LLNVRVAASFSENVAGPPGTSSVKVKPVPPAGDVRLMMLMVPVVGAAGGVPIWPRICGPAFSDPVVPCTSR